MLVIELFIVSKFKSLYLKMCQGLFCLTQLATHSVGLAEAVSATMTSKFTIVFASHTGD